VNRFLLGCFLVAATGAAATGAGMTNGAAPSIMADAIYVREPADGAWSIRLRGQIPSLSGAWLLAFDSAGKVLHSGLVPHGDYPDEKPFILAFPPDGRAGDYAIRLIGRQEDLMGVRLPLTDLPFEVYGGRQFAVSGGKASRVCFKGLDRPKAKASLEDALAVAEGEADAPKADEGGTRVTLGAYKGHLTVRDEAGKTVADTRTLLPGTENEVLKYSNLTTFPTAPGATYWLERECLYFSSTNAFYIAVDPGRWFQPDPRHESIKWWVLP
jgi:hypothetical protein